METKRGLLCPTVSDEARRHSVRLIGVWFTAVVIASLTGRSALGAADVRPTHPIVERTEAISIVDANDIAFTRFAANTRLSQKRVSEIVQDDQGFMWFGTQYGLNRFDGYKFRVFTHDPQRPESLAGVYIKALFKDPSGVLWVACDQFLDRFDSVTETFTHYRIGVDGEPGHNATVHSINEDGPDKLWLATDDGLYVFDKSTGHSAIVMQKDAQGDLTRRNIKYAGLDRAGNFWVTSDEGLDQLDQNTGRVVHRIALPVLRELSFYQDRSGTFWIFYATGSGLAKFDRQTQTLTRFTFVPAETLKGANLGISSVLEDSRGRMWFGTNGSGLFRFDRARNCFIRYSHHPGDLQSLATDAVVALYEDREGNIWTALHGMQVNVFSTHALPFQKLTYGSPPAQTRGGTMVNAILEDSSDTLWISYVGMLYRVNRKTNTRQTFPITLDGIGADTLSMAEDRLGNIWFATTDAGLLRYNIHDAAAQYFIHRDDRAATLSSNAVARVLVDHRGDVWAATWDGLDRYDTASRKFVSYSRISTKHSEHYISLAEDATGLLWLGSNDSGLQTLDPATGKFRIYRHDEYSPSSLSNNRVNSVFIDQNKRIWVGTQDGLDLFNPSAGSFRVYYDSDGLGGNVVSCILEDEKGNLWMSTNSGISHFDPESGHFENYTMADGLPGTDFSGWGSCFKSRRGEMFFGGYAGATSFFPQRLASRIYTPRVVFTEFELAGMPVNIGGRSPLSKAITYTNEVVLSHKENSFSVGFAALSFRNSESNRYRYQLEGLDTDWHEVQSDRRLASFTTLPAGMYRLIVEGAVSNGPWSDPAILRIRVMPPWWATWWFRISCILAASIILLFIYFIRLRQLKRQIRVGLEMRHAERERIARELHDTLLQTIQASKLVADGVRDANIPCSARQSLEKLSTWLGKAMDEGRAALDSLRGSDAQTGELAESLGEAAEHGAPASMQVAMSVSGDARLLHPAVRDEVHRIASEAVRNACAHSSGSLLTIQVKYGRNLTIHIEDNGRGFDKEFIAAGRPGHFGIAGMKERATKIGADISIGTQAGKGTRIILTVPGRIIYGRRGISYKRSSMH